MKQELLNIKTNNVAVVKLTNLSRLFRHFADMIDNGYCDNITEDDIDAMTEVLKPYLNVKVNYEQAKKITGKTDSAFNSKISRLWTQANERKALSLH